MDDTKRRQPWPVIPDSEHAASRSETSAESVVRAYWERVWLERDLDALEDLVTDPVVRHTAEGTHSLTRREYRRRLADAFEAWSGPPR